jgi:hypothetical protein
MRRIVLTLVMAGMVAACAGAPGNGSQSDGGGQVLAAVGTPFLIVAKVPVCVLTLAVAGPIAAVNELGEDGNSLGQEVHENLADGIDRNCGPPYAISP